MKTLLQKNTIQKNAKQNVIKILTGLLVSGLLSAPISANPMKTLSLDALNTNIKWCFDATLNVAEIKAAKNNLNKVTKPCDKILRNKIKPGNVEANALFNRGVIYFHGEQFESAVNDFTKALQHSPNLYQANIALGEIAIKQEKLQDALSYYESAVKANGENAALKNKRNWIVAELRSTPKIQPKLTKTTD